jgi:hypothetical protein
VQLKSNPENRLATSNAWPAVAEKARFGGFSAQVIAIN